MNWPDHERLLDPELDSYTLVTYRPSQLTPSVLRSVDVVAVTRLAERSEVDAIRQLTCVDVTPNDWYNSLANLDITEAALLPPTDEARGHIRRFCVAPRLTHHVRHQTKYFDIPVATENIFVFTDDGTPLQESSATLRELMEGVGRVTTRVVEGHLRRHDFSSWIANVFGDHELANIVRRLESEHHKTGAAEDFSVELSAAIEQRYECDIA